MLAKLRLVRGLKIHEIARDMGVGRTTVKRGLRALRGVSDPRMARANNLAASGGRQKWRLPEGSC